MASSNRPRSAKCLARLEHRCAGIIGRCRDGAFEPRERRREIMRQARLVTHLEQCADILRIDLEGTGQQAFGG